jgi:hypothetical protein
MLVRCPHRLSESAGRTLKFCGDVTRDLLERKNLIAVAKPYYYYFSCEIILLSCHSPVFVILLMNKTN